MGALAVVRALPAYWDGMPVEWGDLAVTRGSLDLHLPPKCDACGSTTAPYRAGGTLTLGADKRSGRPLRRLALYAQRCRVCQHDVIYDERTGQSWDLGPEDYGPQGSSDVVGSLW